MKEKLAKTPCRGFTLIEVLVVCAVLAILVALALSALASSRRSARAAACIAAIRAVGVATSAYTGDHKGTYPMLAQRREFLNAWTAFGTDYAWSEQTTQWVNPVSAYFPTPTPSPAQTCPSHDAPGRIGPAATMYYLTFGAFTAPELWSPDRGDLTESMLRAVREDEAAHPSRKILFYERTPLHLLGARVSWMGSGRIDITEPAAASVVRSAARVDLSALGVRDDKLVPPFRGVMPPGWSDQQHAGFATLDGIRGVDFP